jgi:hypothetical protein
MIRRRVPQQGDAYWVNPNPVAGREMMKLRSACRNMNGDGPNGLAAR